MALYKRKSGGAWWVRFQSGGKTIRRSTGTSERELAQEIEASLRTRYIRKAKLGESVYTWKEAVAQYRKESNWRDSTKTRNEYALTFFVHIGHRKKSFRISASCIVAWWPLAFVMRGSEVRFLSPAPLVL